MKRTLVYSVRRSDNGGYQLRLLLQHNENARTILEEFFPTAEDCQVFVKYYARHHKAEVIDECSHSGEGRQPVPARSSSPGSVQESGRLGGALDVSQFGAAVVARTFLVDRAERLARQRDHPRNGASQGRDDVLR
jgi:hypothetical protein